MFHMTALYVTSANPSLGPWITSSAFALVWTPRWGSSQLAMQVSQGKKVGSMGFRAALRILRCLYCRCGWVDGWVSRAERGKTVPLVYF